MPVHAADDYLQKLISLGFRVAVCEQVEDSAEAKKRGGKSVVRRDVVRLVTPGTITEEKLLSPSESNYLMALARIRGGTEPQLALAWIDISTGVFRLAETEASRLLADILRIDPRELITAGYDVPRSGAETGFRRARPHGGAAAGRPVRQRQCRGPHHQIFRRLDAGRFRLFHPRRTCRRRRRRRLCRKDPDLRAAAARLPERESGASTLFIDPATRGNLELVRTLSGDRNGSLLKAIDRTVTGGGARLLAERLMSPLTDPARVNERLDLIGFLADEPSLCNDLRTALKHVPDMPRALSRLALDRGGPRDLWAIRRDSGRPPALPICSAAHCCPRNSGAALAGLRALLAGLEALLAGMLSDELPLLKRDGGFLRRRANAELDEVRALRDQSRRVDLPDCNCNMPRKPASNR